MYGCNTVAIQRYKQDVQTYSSAPYHCDIPAVNLTGVRTGLGNGNASGVLVGADRILMAVCVTIITILSHLTELEGQVTGGLRWLRDTR